MVVITGVTEFGSSAFDQSSVSDRADPVDDTVEISVPSRTTHCFVGIQMFDSGGVQRISGAATGTFTVSVKTSNTELFEAPPDPIIDATKPTTISVAGNIKAVRVVPNNVAGNDVTTWLVHFTCNRN